MQSQSKMRFHLNHVGYKEKSGNWCSKTLQPFIWTMWDIKGGVLTGILTLRPPFHLNHVGYKAIIFSLIIQIMSFHLNHVGYKVYNGRRIYTNIDAFIWTMWDIKISVLMVVSSSLILTFIWTMWDIKCFVGYRCCYHRFFHLNHVGYKVCLKPEVSNPCLTFIWTMWDIKEIFTGFTFLIISLSSEPCGI